MGAVANAAVMARDPGFRDRALAALVYQARDVLTGGTTGFRVDFARSVVMAPSSYADTVAWVMAADPQVATNTLTAMLLPAGEALLLERVSAAWDYLAAAVGPYPR